MLAMSIHFATGSSYWRSYQQPPQPRSRVGCCVATTEARKAEKSSTPVAIRQHTDDKYQRVGQKRIPRRLPEYVLATPGSQLNTVNGIRCTRRLSVFPCLNNNRIRMTFNPRPLTRRKPPINANIAARRAKNSAEVPFRGKPRRCRYRHNLEAMPLFQRCQRRES